MRMLFLAIDAGDASLLEKWAGDGRLPALRSLFTRSIVGKTASVDGLYEGSTWPCFYTGVNPARHGFHRLTQIQPGTYDFRSCLPGECILGEPFWERLSRAGKRLAILDVPLVDVSHGLNGIHMVEWGSHDAVFGFRAWPPELKTEVLERFGKHPAPVSCDSRGRSADDFRRFTGRLIAGVEKKRDLTLHYLAQSDWDLFLQVFTEGHCAGHQCWHLHDPTYPGYDPAVVALTGDPVQKVYTAIDQAIGEILASLDRDTVVFFLASHGMAHNVGADFLLEEILVRLGVAERSPDAAISPSASRWAALHPEVASRALWSHLPPPVRAALRPGLLPLHRLAKRGAATQAAPAPLSVRLNLPGSQCFPHNNGYLVSGIRVNLRGREPRGIVEPGQGFEDFCRELTGDLLDIVDVATGKRMAKRVIRVGALFEGENVDRLPDLLIEWNDEVRVGSKRVRDDASCRLRVASEKIGSVEGEYVYCRTGDHRPHGLFAVAGPGILPGRLERTVSIMDFAPTLLTWFRVAPGDVDGRPIREIPGVAQRGRRRP